MDPNLVCLIVGFALGFGVRSALSKYRRAQVRNGSTDTEHEFQKLGPPYGKRQPLISAASLGGDWGTGADGLNPQTHRLQQRSR
jgi:hypothetical protein